MLFTFLLAALMVGAGPARYEQWVEERRIDLCAEAIIQCPVDKQAEKMADLLLPFRRAYIPNPSGYAGPVFKLSPWKQEKTPHYKGESVFVPAYVHFTLIRAGRCTVQEVNRASYFVAVRDGITEKFLMKVEDYPGEWDRSVVIIGSSASVPRCDCSLIICDGDLKVMYETSRSAIIANGNIEFRGEVHRCRIYAAGTVDGTVKKTKVALFSNKLHENGKEMPVRFLDLGQDLGLKVSDKLVLEDDWRGLRKGDIIAKIDGATVDSIPALRKYLRTGVRCAATVEAHRGNETVTRLVWLDLNPITFTVAPPPREAKP